MATHVSAEEDYGLEGHSELGGVTVDSLTLEGHEGSIVESDRSTLSSVPSSYEVVKPDGMGSTRTCGHILKGAFR